MKYIASILVMIMAVSAHAQDVTIDGVTVTVSTGTTVTMGGALTNKSDNGEVDLNGTAVLTVAGTLTNNSSNTELFPTDAGDVQLLGASGQSVAGSNTIDFYDLTLNNTHADGVTLNTDITVANDMTFTDGDVDLNGETISLGTTGQLVSESNDARVYGTSGEIQATGRVISGTGEIAGLGLNISSFTAGATIDIDRGHAEQTGVGGATSILRYFDITATAGSPNLDMQIQYYDNELNSKTEANLLVDRSTDGGSTWSAWAGSSVTTGSNYATAPSVTAFSRWTLSAANALALPVELLSFEALYEDGHGVLQWVTSSETNNAYFTIEKSADGDNWDPIGALQGAGTTSMITEYDFTDYNLDEGQTYYRVKQTDFNGDFKYSEVAVLNWTEKNLPQVFAHLDKVVIDKNASDFEDDMIHVEMVDGLGRTVLISSLSAGRKQFDMQHLSTGVYLVNLRDAESNFISTEKVVIR